MLSLILRELPVLSLRTRSRPHTVLSSRAQRGICFFLLLGVLLVPTAFRGHVSAVESEPHRPRILGIVSVRVLARDLRASRDFYSKVLTEDHPCIWCGQVQENTFSVNYLQYVQLVPSPSAPPSNRIDQIIFETDNVPALWSYLTSQGVGTVVPTLDESPFAPEILQAPKHPEAQKTAKVKKETVVPQVYFYALDPEGHRIGFRQLPAEVHKTRGDADKMHLIHAGFTVKDRAIEDHFYKDILGFHLYWHGGMKDDKDDWVDMQVPDGTDWIEFMLNIPPDADKHLLGIMNHFAIGVSDVAQSAFAVRRNGLSYPDEPKIGRDGKWQLNLYDPDDTRVEFMEFTPVQKPCCSEFTGPHPKP